MLLPKVLLINRPFKNDMSGGVTLKIQSFNIPDKEERRRIAHNTIQAAVRNHDSSKISRSFPEAICSLKNIKEEEYA
jgi:hypothetical protein